MFPQSVLNLFDGTCQKPEDENHARQILNVEAVWLKAAKMANKSMARVLVKNAPGTMRCLSEYERLCSMVNPAIVKSQSIIGQHKDCVIAQVITSRPLNVHDLKTISEATGHQQDEYNTPQMECCVQCGEDEYITVYTLRKAS